MSFSVIMIMIVIIIIIIIIIIMIIIIIIIKGTGVGQVGPQLTPGTSTTPPTRVWGDTFGKCL